MNMSYRSARFERPPAPSAIDALVVEPVVTKRAASDPTRRQLGIEEILHWTYRDELPLRQLSSAEGMWVTAQENGDRGGIDVGHGAAQRYPHLGLPHPDALIVERAVGALPTVVIDWDASRAMIMGDLSALMTARDVIMVRTLRTDALVTMHARMQTRPDWREDPPLPQKIMAERGPNVKVVGERWARNVYSPGSHCPLRYEPSVIAIAEARADYFAWWWGQKVLAETLVLNAHVVLPPSAPPTPWLDPGVRTSIIDGGGDVALQLLPLAPARGWKGPPHKQRLGGPVRTIEIGD